MGHKLPEKLEPPQSGAVWLEGSIPHTVNQLIDYLKEREETVATNSEKNSNKLAETITILKPEWWGTPMYRMGYDDALEACSKASGITFNLE